MEIKKAVRHQKKLRLALIGPTGAGKTLTALELAVGLAQGGKVLMVDSEHGRGSLYADRYDFDVIELDNFDPLNYIEAIRLAESGGYAAVILDSLSHAWNAAGGVLDKVNRATGNQFTDGWGKIGTPLQNKLVEAILTSSIHVIATLRAKMDYVVETDSRGKAVPRKLGLAPVQRADMEYEFDFIWRMDLEHVLTVDKSYDRHLPVGHTVREPDRKLAVSILEWLETGAIQEYDRKARGRYLVELRAQQKALGATLAPLAPEQAQAMSNEDLERWIHTAEESAMDLKAAKG